MDLFLDLITIKSKPQDQQQAIIAAVQGKLVGNSKLSRMRDLAREEVPDILSYSDEKVVLLWILAMYAADIGTVPLRQSRELHLQGLDDLCSIVGIAPRLPRRLSVHADEVQELVRQELCP